MTWTDAAPTAETPGATASGTAKERREAKRRRRRTTRTVVVTTTVVALVMAAGGLAWHGISTTDDLAARNAAAKELLTASEGKVVRQNTRAGLSAQIAAVDALLAEPFLTRVTTGTGDAGEALAAASDGVHASMVEFARERVTTARAGLDSVAARAEMVYTATEGKGVDDAVRAPLQAALKTAETAGREAKKSLAGSDLAALEQAQADLDTNRSVVDMATETLSAAQDAITCPAPDQVWDPESGAVPAAELAPIPWATDHVVRADVLGGLIELDAAYREQFGEHLTINSSYRSYEAQKSIYDPSSPIAAPPGCSNHGLGLAVDIGGGVETFDTEQYLWLKQHARTYGWMHPAFAEPDGRVPEPWHWESVLARAGA